MILTANLELAPIKEEDFFQFKELLSAPEIVSAIPQAPYAIEQIQEKFKKVLTFPSDIANERLVIMGAYEKGGTELIGLCAFLTNDEGHREIGYRFREKYWGKGYATQATNAMIDYCFEHFPVDRVTADVWKENKASVRVLEKFFRLEKEFFNEEDNCYDRRYVLFKSDWNA